jgi:hypothetical protein
MKSDRPVLALRFAYRESLLKFRDGKATMDEVYEANLKYSKAAKAWFDSRK